jgi:DNA-binding HxlR family transcriptional regulator
MALLDLLGRRWALRILWELREDSLNFNELQSRCDRMSSSVLAQRLVELREAAILQQDAGGNYTLTPQGQRLLQALTPLQEWATHWSVDEATHD